MNSSVIVYDVGMNNGDDTAYYLSKGLTVIAIEANPNLCDQASIRFKKEISEGRCTILNIGVADKSGCMDFYLNTKNHITSTFVPQRNEDGSYKIIPIKVEKLSNIIKKYGDPLFCKIDVEGMDFIILKDLFLSGLRPLQISVEVHKIDVFCMLVCMGYDEFRVIDCREVHKKYSDHVISIEGGSTRNFSFPHNSSGPFGDDLKDRWSLAEEAAKTLLSRDHTWQDVHARNLRSTYEDQAQRQGREDLLQEVALAYAYWNRYDDVAEHPYYGAHGELGLAGARTHYENHGQHGENRKWEL